MKKGDLVKVIDPGIPAPIEVGDLAILTEIDWDQNDHPDGIVTARGKRITGRGYFFFPSKPEVHNKFRGGSTHLGVMLIFENFEIVDETR